MEPYPVDVFRGEVAAMPLAGEQDLVAFLPPASRLAALPGGGCDRFMLWPELAEKLGARFSDLLRARVDEGLWDLDQALGENLAAAVVDAEDFACFSALARELTPDAAARHLSGDIADLFDLWRDEAENAPLDAAAVSFLEDWADLFPIRADLRLDAVRAPFSAFERAVLAGPGMSAAPAAERFDISALSAGAEEGPRLLAADGGGPSRALMDLYALDLVVDSGGHGQLLITRRLDAEWNLRLTVERGADGGRGVLPLSAARHGVWPARPRGEDWVTELRFLSRSDRFRILRSPLWLVPLRGTRICLE